MPQMMPMLWFFLFTFSTLLIMIMSCLIFFFHILSTKKLSSLTSVLPLSKKWKWMW